jgi:small subunit ribosomal protein S1
MPGQFSEEFEITPAMRAWADVKEAHRTGKILTARSIGIETKSIKDSKEEVLKLDFNGVYGYMPKSLVDNYNLRGIQHYLDRELEFVVDKVIIDPNANVGIFLANRAKALEKKAERFWREAQEGQIFNAFVRGVDKYTLFLLVEGVPIELNRSEVGYMYYEDLTEAFEIGDILPVKLSSITRPSEDQKGKITVDSKTLQFDPWTNIVNYQENGIYVGRITKIHPDHGMFVELVDSPGLVVRTNFPPYTGNQIFKKGETIRVRIAKIDAAGRRMKAIAFIPHYSKKRNNDRYGSYGVYGSR